MTVTLNRETLAFVEEKVRTGQFASADEEVNSLLSQVQAQEELTAEDIAELRDEVDLGIAELDRGETSEFTANDVIAERHAALASRKRVS